MFSNTYVIEVSDRDKNPLILQSKHPVTVEISTNHVNKNIIDVLVDEYGTNDDIKWRTVITRKKFKSAYNWDVTFLNLDDDPAEIYLKVLVLDD